MTLNNNQQNQTNTSIEVVSDVNDGRRKISKAGLITPVLLSLSSKPVWAVECGVSGTQSGNLSQQCTNPPHGFSATQFSRALIWPLPYIKESTTFDSVFGVSPNGSLFGSQATLLAVLNGGVSIALNDTNLRTAFGCTGNTNKLKESLVNYAIQSVVSTLNDAMFPNYAYAGPSSFYSAIAVSPSASCNNRANIIIEVTGKLALLKP